MKKQDILYERELETNRQMAKSSLYLIAMLLIVLVLVPFGVFDTNVTYVVIICSFLLVVLGIPAISMYVMKINGKFTKYMVTAALLLMLIPCYLFYGYYGILGLTAPLIIAAVYNDVKMLKIMMFVLVMILIVCHSLIPFIPHMMNEEYTLLHESLLFGCAPRIMVMLAIYSMIKLLIKRNLVTVDYILEHNEALRISSGGLEKVLVSSNRMLYAENFKAFVKEVVKSVVEVGGFLNEYAKGVKCTVMMKNLDGEYLILNEKKKRDKTKVIIKNDKCYLKDVQDFSIDLKNDTDEGLCEINKDNVVMTFYENGLLLGMVYINISLDTDCSENNTIINMLYNAIKLCMATKNAEEILTTSQEELIFSFSEISESKSRETGQHIKRVSEYMRVIGKHICKTKKEVENLACASMLHDVGKLMIPSEVLEKPGRLTDEEYEIIKSHTMYGGELLKNVPGEMMKMAYDIATQHHERWDGKGYDKIEGEDISYYARYVSVIDVFDALISKRCYKEAWSVEKAYEEIVKNAGTQFAPHAVEVFKECFDEIVAVYHKYPDAS